MWTANPGTSSICGSANYVWEKETYFGRTIQESHKRTTGHRSCPCTLDMSIVWTFLWISSTFQSWLTYPLSNSEEPSSNSLKNTILFRVDSTDTNARAGFLNLLLKILLKMFHYLMSDTLDALSLYNGMQARRKEFKSGATPKAPLRHEVSELNSSGSGQGYLTASLEFFS